MLRRRARIAVVAALAAAALLGLHPLLGPKYPDGHDAWIYPARVVLFETALAEGQIPPLWAAALASGHGQPHFEFVPPLLYALAMPLRFAGADLTHAIVWPLALLHVLGTIAAYRIARRRSERLAATATAVAWLYAPYVATDLYVRAAFAEAAGIACAPIALLFVLRLLDRPQPARIAAAAAATSLVLMSHNGVSLLFVAAIGFFAVLRPGRARFAGMAGIGYALALTSFFWLPAMVERSYVRVERLREPVDRRAEVGLEVPWIATAHAAEDRPRRKLPVYARHAVEPWQLVWSEWGYGKSRDGADRDGMSFQIGWLHLVLGGLGVVAAWRERHLDRGRERLAFAVVAVGGAWLATTWAMPLWSWIGVLQYLAFPWRALFLPALFLPLVMTGVFERIGARATIAAIVALLAWNLPHMEPWRTVWLRDAGYSRDAIETRGLRASSVEEYAPRWAFMGTGRWPERVRSPDVSLAAEELERSGIRERYRVTMPSEAAVWVAPFFYPGWRAWIDGIEVPIAPAPRSGVIEVRMPAGEHELRIEFGTTPTRWIANAVTLSTIVVLLGFALRNALDSRRGSV